MTSVGSRLRAARERAGLSQAQVAEKAGIAQGSVSRIERPSSTTRNMHSIAHAANALGLSLDCLFDMGFSTLDAEPTLAVKIAEQERLVHDLETRIAVLEAAGAPSRQNRRR